MTRNCTFRGLLALLLTSFSLYYAQAQVIFTENFNDQAAAEASWSSGGTNGGSEVWYWENDPSASTFGAGPFAAPTAALGYFHFDSDANGENNMHDVTLTGPSFDCSASTDTRLSFHAQYAYFNAFSEAFVGVSTNGGVDWTEYKLFVGLPNNTMFNGPVNLSIPAANGQSDVRLRFRWVGDWEYTFKVDDIEVSNFVAPSHDITFRVNASLITVDAGGMRIAGDFTGWADQVLTDQGNGIWSGTFTLQEGQTYQYKFKNGPSGWESGQAACGVPDGFGGFNRTVTPSGPATLSAVCFNSCDPCPAASCDQNPDAIICDNFDTYNTTQGITVQSPANWQIWPGGATAFASTEQAASAPNSLKIFSNNPNGGPMDMILNLQNKTTGRYSLKWKMYVPMDKGGYFNIQNVTPVTNGDWNLDVFFNTDTTGNIQIGAGPSLGNFVYPKATWFTVDFTIDLDNNILSLFINGKYVKKMAYPKNLGGINFYPLDNNALYYIDDLEYVALPALVFDADDCGKAVDITALFGAAAGVSQVSGIYDNTNATVAPNDPPAPSCFLDGIPNTMPMINGSMWFTFTGDGKTYDIQTVPCNSTNYIDDGDTQMAIYTGSCGDFTLIECNEDLFSNGQPDYRAGVTLETENGKDYYMLIDGWSTTFQGQFILATGEFCVQVTQVAGIPCSAGQVGTFTLNNNGFLCFNQNLNTLMVPDPASFVIPNQGPVFGMCWTITNQPLDPNVWPGAIPGIASTVFNPEVILVSLPNTGNPFAPGTYYLTPVVVGGATLIDPAGAARIFNVDPANGCFFVGQSQAVVLLPNLPPLGGTGVVTNVTDPPGNNGAIVFNPTGGFPGVIQDPSQYIYQWSGPGGFTASTKNINGLAPGTYTVLLSDPSGCTDPFVASFTVNTVSAPDPQVVQTLQVSPNPTTGVAMLDLRLERSAEVRIEVINAIGQTVQTRHAGAVTNLQEPLQLGSLPNGAYMLRVIIDNEAAMRRIVVQR